MCLATISEWYSQRAMSLRRVFSASEEDELAQLPTYYNNTSIVTPSSGRGDYRDVQPSVVGSSLTA